MSRKTSFHHHHVIICTISLLLLLFSDPFLHLTAAAGTSFRLTLHDRYPTQPVRARPAAVQPNDWGSPLTAEKNRYIVKFTVGTPPSQVAAVFDTIGNFTWIPCLFCKGCSGIYDPSKSTSYTLITCANECPLLPGANCFDGHSCQYDYTLPGRWRSKGVLAQETFDFGGGSTTASFMFGCGNGENSDNQNGVLAFGRNGMAVPTQLNAQKFAYCLGTSGGHLRFGNDFELEGGTTPIIPVAGLDNLYTVRVEYITVGGAIIPAPTQPAVFDVGADLTVVPSNTLDALVSKVRSAVPMKTVQDPSGHSPLCYVGKVQDMLGVPLMVVGFGGEGRATLTLGPANLFLQVQETIACLAFARGDSGLPVIGRVLQQDHAIGYDAVQDALSIGPQDCSKF